jgi:hypothetical protein
MVILLLGLICSVFLKYDLSALMDWQHALAVLLLLILSIMNKRNIIGHVCKSIGTDPSHY